jgi:prepilin-type N-terminal cleavage/methylation domain-containing protein
MKAYCHLLINQRVRSGFTLIELMMASMLTLVVVGAAGYGTVVMLRENTASSIASDTQYNLNRAADFIIEEIKMANSVVTTAPSPLPSGCTTFVLGLNMAGLTNPTSGQTNSILYCLATTTASDVWLGKNVISRYGPALNADGSYGTGTWTLSPLVDLIAETPQSSTCPTNWTRIPSGTPKGFFVCIENTTQKMIELHLSASALDINANKAQTTQWINPNTSSRLGGMATYEVVTQTYIRAPNNVTIAASPTVTKGSNATFTFTRSGDTSSALTGSFTVSGSGTAVAGTDYTAPGSTSITFAAGSTTATLTIATLAGATTGRTIIVTAAGGSGYAVGGTSSATVTIQ